MIDFHALNARMNILGSSYALAGDLTDEEAYARLTSEQYWLGGTIPTFEQYQAEWAAFELDETRAAKKAAINAAFESIIAEGYQTNAFPFRSTSTLEEIDMLDKAARLAQRIGLEETQITDYAGELHTVTVDDLNLALNELGINWRTLWMRRDAAHRAIATAETVETVEAITL